MKAGPVGLSTRGAVVSLPWQETLATSVTTRLTGGTVVELEVDASYVYEFNVAGDGGFTLAIRGDGEQDDLGQQRFDAATKEGPHSARSFAFRVKS